MEIFISKLLEWNRTHNLTGAKNEKDIIKNIEDSLAPLEMNLIATDFKKAADVGTGGGFPGLILAMAMPECSWTLIEPRVKRAAFLHYIKSLLNLSNVTVERKRAETITEKFDLITSRAVTKSSQLVKICKNMIKKDTVLLLYKGESLPDELKGLESFEAQIHERGKRRYLILKSKESDAA